MFKVFLRFAWTTGGKPNDNPLEPTPLREDGSITVSFAVWSKTSLTRCSLITNTRHITLHGPRYPASEVAAVSSPHRHGRPCADWQRRVLPGEDAAEAHMTNLFFFSLLIFH